MSSTAFAASFVLPIPVARSIEAITVAGTLVSSVWLHPFVITRATRLDNSAMLMTCGTRDDYVAERLEPHRLQMPLQFSFGSEPDDPLAPDDSGSKLFGGSVATAVLSFLFFLCHVVAYRLTLRRGVPWPYTNIASAAVLVTIAFLLPKAATGAMSIVSGSSLSQARFVSVAIIVLCLVLSVPYVYVVGWRFQAVRVAKKDDLDWLLLVEGDGFKDSAKNHPWRKAVVEAMEKEEREGIRSPLLEVPQREQAKKAAKQKLAEEDKEKPLLGDNNSSEHVSIAEDEEEEPKDLLPTEDKTSDQFTRNREGEDRTLVSLLINDPHDEGSTGFVEFFGHLFHDSKDLDRRVCNIYGAVELPLGCLSLMGGVRPETPGMFCSVAGLWLVAVDFAFILYHLAVRPARSAGDNVLTVVVGVVQLATTISAVGTGFSSSLDTLTGGLVVLQALLLCLHGAVVVFYDKSQNKRVQVDGQGLHPNDVEKIPDLKKRFIELAPKFREDELARRVKVAEEEEKKKAEELLKVKEQEYIQKVVNEREERRLAKLQTKVDRDAERSQNRRRRLMYYEYQLNLERMAQRAEDEMALLPQNPLNPNHWSGEMAEAQGGAAQNAWKTLARKRLVDASRAHAIPGRRNYKLDQGTEERRKYALAEGGFPSPDSPEYGDGPRSSQHHYLHAGSPSSPYPTPPPSSAQHQQQQYYGSSSQYGGGGDDYDGNYDYDGGEPYYYDNGGDGDGWNDNGGQGGGNGPPYYDDDGGQAPQFDYGDHPQQDYQQGGGGDWGNGGYDPNAGPDGQQQFYPPNGDGNWDAAHYNTNQPQSFSRPQSTSPGRSRRETGSHWEHPVSQYMRDSANSPHGKLAPPRAGSAGRFLAREHDHKNPHQSDIQGA